MEKPKFTIRENSGSTRRTTIVFDPEKVEEYARITLRETESIVEKDRRSKLTESPLEVKKVLTPEEN